MAPRAPLTIRSGMVWFYCDDDQHEAHVETRYDNRSAEYVLVLNVPGIRRREERFATAFLFRRRLLELSGQLSAERWKQKGPPTILRHGWPDKAPVH